MSIHLYYAQTIAETIRRAMEPYCEPGFCHIAGSIRRKMDFVKDMEIVCIPQISIHRELNLFQEVVAERPVIHPEFEKLVRQLGVIVKGEFLGRYMQIEMSPEFEGKTHEIKFDLFMPQRHDYWRQLAIRTGSATYSHKHIATAWVKKGWCGVNGDLFLQKDCYRESDKHPWRLKSGVSDPMRPPEWKSEEEFFKWLGIQYLEPRYRSL